MKALIEGGEGDYVATLRGHPDLEDIFGAGESAQEAIDDLRVTLAEARRRLADNEDRLHPRLAAQLAALRSYEAEASA